MGQDTPQGHKVGGERRAQTVEGKTLQQDKSDNKSREDVSFSSQLLSHNRLCEMIAFPLKELGRRLRILSQHSFARS